MFLPKWNCFSHPVRSLPAPCTRSSNSYQSRVFPAPSYSAPVLSSPPELPEIPQFVQRPALPCSRVLHRSRCDGGTIPGWRRHGGSGGSTLPPRSRQPTSGTRPPSRGVPAPGPASRWRQRVGWHGDRGQSRCPCGRAASLCQTWSRRCCSRWSCWTTTARRVPAGGRAAAGAALVVEVAEGTLKGRDMPWVRDAIWSQTGFD